MTAKAKCPDCGGNGGTWRTCSRCSGKGVVDACPRCDGKGVVGLMDNRCSACEGKGVL